MFRKLPLTIFVALIFTFSASAKSGSSNCFPFDRLSAEKRNYAEELLLKALDGEALFTIVGGIKPMSSGFTSFSITVREPRDEKAAAERKATLQKMDDAREILSLWRCGEPELFADVQHFTRTFDGRRTSEAVVFDRVSLKLMIEARSDFFVRWAITPNSHPWQVLTAIENAEMTPRFAGYGYLFGYPNHAVKFFVDAANEEELTGKFVERDFYSISTISSDTNRFVFAVPKGHKETPADKALKARAEKVLSQYKDRRERFIGDGKPGAAALLRDWFCADESRCERPRF